MVINGNYSYKSALTLTPEIMKELDAFLKDRFGKIEYSATIKNKSDIKFDCLEELLNYENAQFNKIEKIEISGNESYLMVLIDHTSGILSKFNDTVNVRYVFFNTDDETLFIEKLNRILNKAKSPCSLLYKISLFHIYVFSFALFIGSIGVSIILNNNKTRLYSTDELVLAIICVLFLILILFVLLSKSMKYFFPPIVFLWGREVESHKRTMALRTNIFWVIIVGIIISILLNFILG